MKAVTRWLKAYFTRQVTWQDFVGEILFLEGVVVAATNIIRIVGAL